MTLIETAREADAREEPASAIHLFDQALQDSSVALEDYLDLAVLYMECGDFGFAAYHRLSQDLVWKVAPRSREVLALAAQAFPESADVRFWQLYIGWRLFNEEPGMETVRTTAADGSLDAFLYLVLCDCSLEHRMRAGVLLATVKDGRSARSRYVRSVLMSVLREENPDQPM